MWVDGFKMIELTEIMRQKEDVRFTELLCRMRKAECTADDVDILESCTITEDATNFPINAIHVYRLNIDVDKRNNLMLDSIATANEKYCIEANDSIAGQAKHIDWSQISKKRSETGGLHDVLK